MDSEYGKDKYVSIGKHYKSIPGKLFGLCYRNIELLNYCYGKNYDIFTGFGSFYASFTSRFFRNRPYCFLMIMNIN